jgi:WD40 repeat protein
MTIIRVQLKILYILPTKQQLLPHVNIILILGSSDGTLQIVDMRVGDFKKSQIMIKAHDKDVNVCDWNRINHSLIVTGSDDGSVKVWDLRKCK